MAGEKEEIPHHKKYLNAKVQLNMSDGFLFMPEHHQNSATTKKKGLILLLHLFRHLVEQLTDLGIKHRAGKREVQ